MTQDEAFLQAIRDSPEDDTPRLVYADWLMERGDPRGEFIHLQCRLPHLSADDDRSWLGHARAQQLLHEHGKGWVGPLRRLVKRWQFRRGFVEGVTLHAATFLDHAGELFRLAPIRHVRFLDAGGLLADLARSPHLARLAGLDLRHNAVDADQFAVLLASPHLTGLRYLGLRGTGLCNNAGLQLLAASPQLAQLTALDLSDQRYSIESSGGGRGGLLRYIDHPAYQAHGERQEATRIDALGMRALVESPHLTQLTRLRLAGYCRLDTETMAVLADSPFLGRLTHLDLSHTAHWDWGIRGGPTGRQQVLQSPHAAGLRVLRLCRWALSPMEMLTESTTLTRLEVLDVSSTELRRGEAQVLARAQHLPNLTTLNVAGCYLNSADVRALAGAAHFPRLAALDLSENQFDQEAVDALAASPLLGQLRALSLQGPGDTLGRSRHSWLRDASAHTLAGSPHGARLRYLDLGNQAISDDGARALAASPHLSGLLTLHLWANRIGADGGLALAGTEHLSQLAQLDLRANALPAAVCRLLRQRFGPGVRYGEGPAPHYHQRDRNNDRDDYNKYDYENEES